MSKKKIWYWILGALAVCGVASAMASPWFKDLMFTKADARDRLKQQNIVLHDEFKVVFKKSSKLNGYANFFVLMISAADRERIKRQISNAQHFLKDVPETFDLRNRRYDKFLRNTTFVVNYKRRDNYVFESYKLYRSGNAPVWSRVQISTDELYYITSVGQ